MSCFINYLMESPLEQHDITIFKAIVCSTTYTYYCIAVHGVHDCESLSTNILYINFSEVWSELQCPVL